MGKIVAIVNQKGGVGKTTTAVNLTAGLGIKGKKILIVDVDPQGNTTSGFGINKKEVIYSSYNLITGDKPAEEIIKKTEFKGVDVIPSAMDLAGAEIELSSAENRETKLKNALASVRENYDYIFLDCPPSLGLVTINGWVASDSVIIPLQSEYYALEGVSQLMNTIAMVKQHLNPGLFIEGVIITMYDGRALISKQIAAEIKKFFKNKLYEIIIPRNVRLAEAPSHGKPIMLYDPKCVGARAYRTLTEEFLSRQR